MSQRVRCDLTVEQQQHWSKGGFPSGSVVKNPRAMPETQVPSLSREDPLEKKMATHSSILAWEIPWTEERQATVQGVAKESDVT